LYEGTVDAEVRLRLWLKTHLVLYSRLRDALRNYGVGAEPSRGSAAVFDFYRRGETEVGTAEKLSSCLKALMDYSSMREMGLHAVYLPSVVEGDFEPLRQAAAAEGISLDPDVPFRVYSSVTARLGLLPIDLRPTLRAVHAKGHALTVKADFHYSPELSRAVGARMWAALGFRAKPATATGTR
jgi:hypothetical protein